MCALCAPVLSVEFVSYDAACEEFLRCRALRDVSGLRWDVGSPSAWLARGGLAGLLASLPSQPASQAASGKPSEQGTSSGRPTTRERPLISLVWWLTCLLAW